MGNENMRDRLLARLPQPENIAEYRNEVTALLDRNDKKLRQEKWYSGLIWGFVAGLGTIFLWQGGKHASTATAAYLGTFACFFLIYGAVELLKHFINRSRVELLKEIKQLQLQVLELQAKR